MSTSTKKRIFGSAFFGVLSLEDRVPGLELSSNLKKGMQNMKNQIRYWMVTVWFLLAMQVGGTGVLFLQNGDKVDADLVGIVEEGLEVHLPGQADVVDVKTGWPFMWIAGDSDFKAGVVSEKTDVMTLISGQEFFGELTEVDQDTVLFMPPWSQEIKLPRNQVSSVELDVPVSDRVLNANAWEIKNRYENNRNVKSEWLQTGSGWVHYFPRGHVWQKTYDQMLTTARIEMKFYFPGKVTRYALLVSGEGHAGKSHTIRVMQSYSRLNVYDSLFLPKTLQIPLGKENRREGSTHHVVVEYNYAQREINIYFNGELKETQGFFIENEGDPTLTNSTVDLSFNDQKPESVVVQQLGVFPGVAPGNRTGADAGRKSVRFKNGDQLEGPILRFDGKTVRTTIAGQDLSIPAARVAELTFTPLKKQKPSSVIRVSLRDAYPVLEASQIEMTENGQLRLMLKGLTDPLVFPLADIGKIEWPMDMPKTSETPIKEFFQLTYGGGSRFSGTVKALTESGMVLRPEWSTTDLTLPGSTIEELVRMDQHHVSKDETLRSTVVLRNGDYMVGTLTGVDAGAYRVQHASYGETKIAKGHVHLVDQEGEATEGRWIFDAQQAVSHIKGAKNAAYLMPGLSPEGGMNLEVGARLKGKLPQGGQGYHMYLSLKEAKKLQLSVQFDRSSQDRKVSGLSFAIVGDRLILYLEGSKRRNVNLKEGLSVIKTLEIFFDPSAKRLRMLINGELVCDESGLDILIRPKERHFNLSGLAAGVVVEEFWLKPIQGKDWEPHTSEEKKTGVAMWKENRLWGMGQLVEMEEGGLGFQRSTVKKAEALPETGMYVLRFYADDPYAEPKGEAAIYVQLLDQVTRLRGTAVEVSDGKLRLGHPAFPEGFTVPLNEVRAMYWKKPPANVGSGSPSWRR
jgi:hypothetical protein